MRRPTDEEIDAYSRRYGVTADVAWRDYLQLRLASGASRDPKLRELCVWKGAFVTRYVLDSPRASNLDATIGTNRDEIDPAADPRTPPEPRTPSTSRGPSSSRRAIAPSLSSRSSGVMRTSIDAWIPK